MTEEPGQAELPSLVLREADTRRAVRGYVISAAVLLVACAGLQVVEPATLLRHALSAALAVTGAACSWLAWSRRSEGIYTHFEASVIGFMLCGTCLLGVAYIGPLSPVTAVIVLLLVGLALGDVRRGRRIAALLVGGYALVMTLALAGAIPLLNPQLTAGPSPALMGAFVTVVLVAAYVFAVATRRGTEEALAQVQRARIALAGRQAQLDEAFADLAKLAGGHGRLGGAVIGSYRLETLLGRGGMGEVYRARDLDSGRIFAAKVLHASLMPDEAVVARFFREAEICSGLDSPHIVAVRDHGRASDGSPYLVMELVEGEPLNVALRNGPLGPSATLAMLEQVAKGLEVAHGAGIVHRDIKPANLIRSREGIWKLLDFGISKLRASKGTLTRGDVIGTPGYIAPEQARSEDVDQRADIFSLTAVLYRSLTGRPPFSGRDPMLVIVRAMQEQPLRPSLLTPLASDVDAVLAIGLAKDPADRFGSAAELAEALARAFERRLSARHRMHAAGLLRASPWREEAAVTPDEGEGDTVAMVT